MQSNRRLVHCRRTHDQPAGFSARHRCRRRKRERGAPGHTLVIPKAPARNILDVAPDDLAHVMAIAQKIAQTALKVFGADGITVQQFNEPAGGQVVFHLHVHVIPRREGVQLKPPASFKEEPATLSDHALKLAAALKGA